MQVEKGNLRFETGGKSLERSVERDIKELRFQT